MKIEVQCHAGYRGEEEPRAFMLGERRLAVVEILDRWLARDHRYFKTKVDDGRTFVLRHDESSHEWQLAALVNGGKFLTQNAWRGYRQPDFPSRSWAIDGGFLHALAGTEPVSLISRETFADFDLSLEWRLPVGGNSGILYRVTEDYEAPWQSGPEMQLLGGSSHPDSRVPETSCGAVYGIYPPGEVPQCSAGLFNIARVSVRGFRVEHWLNGVHVLSCDMASAEFRARIAESKFRHYPRFARATEGHIVLQHHGSEAWFYNIRLETASLMR